MSTFKTEKELLVAFLSKTLNLDEDGVTSLIYNDDGSELKPEAFTLLVAEQGKTITKLKADAKQAKDEGYGRGKKEAMTAFEKQVREQFELDSNEEGLELINAIVAQVKEQAGTKEITDDDIKTHSLYKTLEKELKRTKAEAATNLTTEVEKVKADWKKEKIISDVVKSALDIIEARNPIALSTDEKKAKAARAKQDAIFKAEMMKSNFDVVGDGDERRIIILGDDGKPAEDEMGHEIEFEAWVNQTADPYYDFQASEERDTPAGDGKKKPAAPGTPTKYTLTKPKDYAEFSKMYEKIENDKNLKAEERIELHAKLGALWESEPAA